MPHGNSVDYRDSVCFSVEVCHYSDLGRAFV